MIQDIIFIFLCLSFPVLVIWLEHRTRFVKTISPIILCYALGLILANIPFVHIPTKMATTLSEVAVPLAIPLLLISTNFLAWIKGAKGAMLSFLLCIVAVTVSATFAAFLFREQLVDSWKLAGMTMGVYTGGTPNMSAIGLSLEVSEETFILINAADLIWGALYLLFLMTLAKPVLGRILPSSKSEAIEKEEEQEVSQVSGKERVKNTLLFLGLAVLILGFAVGLSILLTGSMQAVIIILTVTSTGILLSFVRPIRARQGSYALGDYFLLVFCLALGSLADVSELLNSASDTLFFTAFVMFGAIALHILLASIFRIDRDTVIITSVAGIYGPAFVGPMAKVLNNKSMILTGMTTGLIGYAVGNYLGIGFALLLEKWF